MYRTHPTRPESVSNILAYVAAYLDIEDRKYEDSDDEVQEDLTTIARWLAEHPEIDQQIYATLKER